VQPRGSPSRRTRCSRQSPRNNKGNRLVPKAVSIREWKSPKGATNNRASGKTFWGTYLTCQESFNGCSGTTVEREPIEGEVRQALGEESRYAYDESYPRFDLAEEPNEPNEPNRHGWLTEINPLDPNSTPVKLKALGRFKNENAEMAQANDGRIVVRMGDDERGESIYKYVPNGTWGEGQPIDGTLFVAKFNDDMSGEWLPLTPETTGMEVTGMLILARMAGSKVGATAMGRPEWIAVNPQRVEAYCPLTNNKDRGDAAPVGGPNPRETNIFGQFVCWRPALRGIFTLWRAAPMSMITNTAVLGM
jgi:secreted PhoX family phosphatase